MASSLWSVEALQVWLGAISPILGSCVNAKPSCRWLHFVASIAVSFFGDIMQIFSLRMWSVHAAFSFISLVVPQVALCVSLTLQVPHNIPTLPPSTTAYLTALNSTLHTPITRTNAFIFHDISSIYSRHTDAPTSSSAATSTKAYLLDIACRDYDFASYGVDIKSNGIVEIYRVGRGGIVQGEKVAVGDGPIELRVLKAREFYEKRGGCMSCQSPLSSEPICLP